MTIEEAKQKLTQAVEHFESELKKLRTGRASVSMLENVQVEVYGQAMPLQHTATVTVLDAQMLQIAPYDPSNLDGISASIREDQALGLNPSDDGKVIRVPIPPMTEERRQEVVKQLRDKVEQANISMRNVRHEVLNAAKEQLKDKEISEEDSKRVEKQVTDLMAETKAKIDEIAKAKETDILTV